MLRCRVTDTQLAALHALVMLVKHCAAASHTLAQTGMPLVVGLLSHQDHNTRGAAAALVAALARDNANQHTIGAAAPFVPLAVLVAGSAHNDATRSHAANALHHIVLSNEQNKAWALRAGAAGALLTLCQSQVGARCCGAAPVVEMYCREITCLSFSCPFYVFQPVTSVHHVHTTDPMHSTSSRWNQQCMRCLPW